MGACSQKKMDLGLAKYDFSHCALAAVCEVTAFFPPGSKKKLTLATILQLLSRLSCCYDQCMTAKNGGGR